jgi:Zn-dependent metalloprotease
MDPDLSDAQQQSFADTLQLDAAFRRIRDEEVRLSRVAYSIAQPSVTAATAEIEIYDCQHNRARPGAHVPDPGASSDTTARKAYEETNQLNTFYTQVFGRRSVVMTLVLSIHYGRGYSNAIWDGAQITFGEGDGEIFLDFAQGRDVIAHELTHGVVQHTLQLSYVNEAGGLNEHLADCFGSMFRQWRLGETSAEASWRIGADIMGPGATARGFSCLRDMSDPAGRHCLSRQPTQYEQYRNGMDPHDSSGIPNLAFHTACVAAGGRSWETVGPVWYRAMTGFGPSPNMRMREFADRTRAVATELAPGNAALAGAIDEGWKRVGL